MKKYLPLLIGLAIPHLLVPCPTCVGQLEKDSPAFFSDEFYQSSNEHAFDESDSRGKNDEQKQTIKDES